MPNPSVSRPALRLVEGDEVPSSLDDVYRRYCRYVAAVVLRLDGRCDEVEDLVQDVFVEAARGIRRLRDPEAVKGWLATVAVRKVRRRLRLRRLRRFLGMGCEPDAAEQIAPAASPVDRLLLLGVYRVLDEMPVEDRLAFSLHHIEGEALDRVARLCGCSLATAKRRVARAQKRLQEELSHD